MKLFLAIFCSTLMFTTAYAQSAMPVTDISMVTLDKEFAYIDGSIRPLTRRDSYDNQPHFMNNETLYWTRFSGEQTDIWQMDLNTGEQKALTSTSESEYSPTLMPDGKGISVVRVETDGVQRLWSFDLNGNTPEVILEDIKPVGYHAWIDENTLALFILGDPNMTLQLVSKGTEKTTFINADIGRSIHKVPGKNAISYTQHTENHNVIRIYDLDTGKGWQLTDTVEGAQDYVWLPDGSILMGQGNRLFRYQDKQWKLWAKFEGLGNITRLALSPDGTRLALVHGPVEG